MCKSKNNQFTTKSLTMLANANKVMFNNVLGHKSHNQIIFSLMDLQDIIYFSGIDNCFVEYFCNWIERLLDFGVYNNNIRMLFKEISNVVTLYTNSLVSNY